MTINPEQHLWRTDPNMGRNVYALLSNDVTRPSKDDVLVGFMENSALAENVVQIHNGAMARYGRRYVEVLGDSEPIRYQPADRTIAMSFETLEGKSTHIKFNVNTGDIVVEEKK